MMKVQKLHTVLYTCMFFSLILASLMQVSPAFAQQEQPFPSDDDVNDIARQMYCPVCENIPLDVCDTKACEQWRELIREKLAAGWTEEQIKEYFVLQYGDRVLAEPPRRGLNWLVYILPPAMILAGAVLLYRVLRRMRREPQAAQAASVDADAGEETLDPYVARIEEALKERRK